MDVSQHGLPVIRVLGEQSQREHAVGLTATHALAEDQYALVAQK